MSYLHRNFKRYGSLDCLEVASGDGPYTCVLFHGYGADASDLYPLAGALDSPKIGRWIFPNGLLPAPGLPFGRAWFPIDIAALERAMQTGQFREFSAMPEGIDRAAQAVKEMAARAHLEPGKTILGGFSQGAMLAAHFALNAEQDFAALVLLSGTLLGQGVWDPLCQKRRIPFFQSHGKADPILPYTRAKELHRILETNGWKGDFVSFSGGHEIPPQVLQKLPAFLNSLADPAL